MRITLTEKEVMIICLKHFNEKFSIIGKYFKLGDLKVYYNTDDTFEIYVEHEEV